jgi:hypothetical protein
MRHLAFPPGWAVAEHEKPEEKIRERLTFVNDVGPRYELSLKDQVSRRADFELIRRAIEAIKSVPGTGGHDGP